MEYKEAIGCLLMLEPIPCLLQEVRNIDDAERVGAFNDEALAMR
jgi:hypothetical protein